MRRRRASFVSGTDGIANVARQSTAFVAPGIASERSAAICAPSAPPCGTPLSAEPTRRNAAASKVSTSPSATLKSSTAPLVFWK